MYLEKLLTSHMEILTRIIIIQHIVSIKTMKVMSIKYIAPSTRKEQFDIAPLWGQFRPQVFSKQVKMSPKPV